VQARTYQTGTSLIADIPSEASMQYRTPSAFTRLVKRGSTVLIDNPYANQLFAVYGCPLHKWLKIERSSLRVHQFYDSMEHVGIVKLMSSPEHEAVADLFKEEITLLIRAGVGNVNVISTGSARIVNTNGSRKEPNGLWCPTQRGRTGWPGLVLEVGYSEGLNELRCDAKWWLESSPSIVLPNGISKRSVQQVLIIKVSPIPMTLTIESWVLEPTPHMTRNRGNRGGIAQIEYPTTTLTTVIRCHPGRRNTSVDVEMGCTI
jgi:hypothetical protein